MKVFKVFASSNTVVSSTIDYIGVSLPDVKVDVENKIRSKLIVFTHKTKVIGTDPPVEEFWITPIENGYRASFKASITVSSSFFVDAFSKQEAIEKVYGLQSKRKISWYYGLFLIDFDSNGFNVFVSEKQRAEVSISTVKNSVINGVLTPVEGSPDKNNEFVLSIRVSSEDTPDGYVIVRENGVELVRAFVVNGRAEMRGFFSAGPHTFSIEYSGSPVYYPKTVSTSVNFTNGAIVNPADYNLTIYLDGSEYDFVGDFWYGKASLGRSADMFVDGYGTTEDTAPNMSIVPRSGPGFADYTTMLFGNTTDWFDTDLSVDGQDLFLNGTVIIALKVYGANSANRNDLDGPILINSPSSFIITSSTSLDVNRILFCANASNDNIEFEVEGWNIFTMRFDNSKFEVRKNGGPWSTVNAVTPHRRSNTREIVGGINPLSSKRVDVSYGGIRASAQAMNDADITALELELASRLGL